VRDLKIGFQQKVLQLIMTKTVMRQVIYFLARIMILLIYSPYILTMMQVYIFLNFGYCPHEFLECNHKKCGLSVFEDIFLFKFISIDGLFQYSF
jgi:hypothetical protein